MSTRTSVGVLICTRDRSQSLAKALEALRVCIIPAGMTVEAVVIDNGSADDLGPIVADFADRWPFPARLAQENRPGLAAARNAGLRMLATDWIVLTDDDCLFATDYFVLLQQMTDADRSLQVVGGRVLLDDEFDLPITIKEEGEPRTMSNDDHPAAFLQGCNMCIRREVFRQTGFFDERFGAGARFRSAEDTDFLHRVARAGVRVAYRPDLAVYHAHGRKSLLEASDLYCNYQFGNAAFCMKLVLDGDMRCIRYLRWDLKDIFLKKKYGFERGISKRRRLAAFLNGIFSFVFECGRISGSSDIKINKYRSY